MQIRKLVPYFGQGLAVGLVLGFIAVLIFSSDGVVRRPVVEVKESSRPASLAPSQGPVSYAASVEAAAPAVVNIHTTKTVQRRINPFFDDPFFRRFFGEPPVPQQRRQTSLGSGVVVSADGYILTNNHVIQSAEDILVTLSDGRTAEARIVGTDPESDIAVLKAPWKDLPTITWGDSKQLRVGDVVLAIGNPFGVGQTVTQGIISATGRKQLGISTFENFIQTDAAINPGNSGGALIDAHGELIGVNTAIFSRSGGSQGIGFAIPTTIARNIMTQIIEHGEAIRGWLGVQIQTLTEALAESFELPQTDGVIVAGVLRDGPADRAGVQAGDIITHIDGKKVTDASEALNLIANSLPGTNVEIEGIRKNEPLSLEVEVSKRPQPDKT